MSIVKISGGLGNQLSQLALALEIGEIQQSKTFLDFTVLQNASTSRMRSPEIHDFESRFVSTYIPRYSLQNRRGVLGNEKLQNYFAIRKERNLTHLPHIYGLPIQREQRLLFDSSIDLAKNSYFVGSFTSFQYWKNSHSRISPQLSDFLQSRCNILGGQRDFVGLHARRGDYLVNSKARNFHGYLAEEYYANALELIRSKYPELKDVRIASDDDRFALVLRKMAKRMGLVPTIETENDAKSLLLKMTHSKIFIGSNSTFSWWIHCLGNQIESYMPLTWFISDQVNFDVNLEFPGKVHFISSILRS